MAQFSFIVKSLKVIIVLSLFFFTTNVIFASETVGTIDGNFKFAWGENAGWINFGCDECNVVVTDDALSGHAWIRQYGWINLQPSNSGVTNNGEGLLSGYAWSSNLGWINFSGVIISTNGEFSGYAVIKSDGSRINFNCATGDTCSSADFKVATDWRPASMRAEGRRSSGGRITFPGIANPVNVSYVIYSAYDYLLNILNPKAPGVFTEVPVIAPLPFQLGWNLLPVKAINAFVFAPLPYEIRVLAAKFPELAKTLAGAGVTRLSDIDKLNGVTFNIEGLAELERTLKNIGLERLTGINKLNGVVLNVPGFRDINGKLIGSIGTGKIALISGLPIAKFPLLAKKNLPTEFVFARTSGELIDLNVAISIGDRGEVTQKISTLPGQSLRLVMKPISKARSVTGYFVFKSATPRVTKAEVPRESLVASALFSQSSLIEEDPEPISVENKLVLSSFEYTDDDHDGIYVADVITPLVPGEYEVITVIEYIDPVLGTRQMRMIAVVDPEGYVFEKNNGKETRIPSAVVSLYTLNSATKKYELWGAKEYLQENPQITDVRGTYSFLVPEGSYYFQVEAPGYDPYQGEVFIVSRDSGIHQNIELSSRYGLLFDLDWKTVLLIVVLLLLVYNLYQNRLSGIFKRT